MNLPVKLDADSLGTLIYIIVVVLWVIGNVLSKSKKGSRRPPVARPGETSTEKELREFLETISGKPAVEQEEEVKPRPQPVKIKPRARPSTSPTPAPTPARAKTLTVAVRTDEPELIVPAQIRETAPISSFSKTLTSRGSQWKMPGLSMTALRYALSTNRPIPASPLLDTKTLRNKNELRRIIGGKIILGPPRAFDPYDGVGDYKANP